jgi:molecular chaperone DnaK
MAATFGIDFGTTNSLASVVVRDPDTGTAVVRPLTDADGRPHPSVVWYKGENPIVGRQAKDQLGEAAVGVFGDVVRSPKMFLGSGLDLDVGGTSKSPVDVVADVIRHIREDALSRGFEQNAFKSAVMTIPVNMRGPARAALRESAAKAGVRIHQFVHEPLAALYGHFRSTADFRRELTQLDGQIVLVFDWGGGTLDLTLCQLRKGVLTQIYNAGDSDVGGDKFDERLRQVVKRKHEAKHTNVDWSKIQPGGEARLLQACENAKIALSARPSTTVPVRDLLSSGGPEKDVRIEISNGEFTEACADLIRRGFSHIDEVLRVADIPRTAVAFCLATGGMVAMPAIQYGLREMFGAGGFKRARDAATVISEGAAWIAFDDVRLELCKPIEVLHADDTYVQVIPTGTPLPTEGTSVQTRIDMYCVDPRDAFAKFLFARPAWPGKESLGDARLPYSHITVPVDQFAQPLMERLKVRLEIDHNLIAKVEARSTLREETVAAWIHDLEFGLAVKRNGAS